MVPSSWLGKTIYFVLIDRFFNGDRSNDDFGRGEYDPADDDCFHGGDLAGLIQKLPYIRRLGFDALWLTPPVHNQWINPYISTRGYHGYWAYDFTRIDPHFGTLEDYRRLVDEAHRLGLKVIQDIVVNHTGNYFTVDEKGWRLVDAELKAPNDPVFRMNNPNIPEHEKAGVYNFTPNIADFRDRRQTLNWAMGDLDDINLRSPKAIARFKEIYRYWIGAVGVDAFRVDTVFYTPEDFYERFLHDEDGIKAHARAKGIKDFFVFGEVWSYDYRVIGRYLKEGKRRRLDSAVDLPLNEALTQVFCRKAPTRRLAEALGAKRHNASLWINFVDNHDVERLAARADWPAARQALVALFTLPGIPCVYYGTEAGLVKTREDMFEPARFDERSARSLFLRRLIRLRKARPALSRGRCRLESASNGPGVLAYSVAEGKERYFMVFNTAKERMAYDFGRGPRPQVLLASPRAPKPRGAGILPPESFLVLKAGRSQGAMKGARLKSARLKQGRIELSFSGRADFLLADGNYDRRIPIRGARRGKFSIPAEAFANGRRTLRLLSEGLSNEREVVVRNPYRLLASASPEGQAGLGGRKILPPGDPSYGGQLSIEGAEIWSSGRDLRLVLRMNEVTSAWNPPHGYDHVYFSVFFDFPGLPGGKFFPKLGYALDGFEFNAGFLLYGWDSRSFGPADSTPQAYGRPLAGQVDQKADAEARTVSFTFSADHFSVLKDFRGAKIFASTWDGYLGELRAVSSSRQDWSFSVADGGSTDVPKIYDHILLTL